MNEFPRNCTECEYYKTCQSCFGALGCEYSKEIAEAILNRKENK